MKKSEIKIGCTYAAKVSGTRVRVRITAVSPHGGWVGVNLDTKREARIKTAARLRYQLEKMPKEVSFMTRMSEMAQAAHQVADEQKMFDGPVVTEKIQ